jgi:hypothetical protein
MAATTIANLWVPDIWIRTLNEKVNTLPSLITSPIVRRTGEFDALAEGGGQTVNLPYFRDISNTRSTIQIEGVQPTLNNLTSGKQYAPILNRALPYGVSALSAAVIGSGETPVENLLGQLAINKQKDRQATMVNILRGIFGFASAPNGAGALSAVRNDVFSETGATPPANQCISPYNVADTIAALGELADTTLGGGILMHPLIRASLIKQDQISFKHYSEQSGTLLTGDAVSSNQLEYYKGYRVFVSNLLQRAGGVSGYVFDTYIFAPGVFAWGEKAQRDGTLVADVASLSLYPNPQLNQVEIYDRSRFLLHPNGMKWTGAPAGQSAADSELSVATNWTLDYASADRVGIVSLRSNG